VRERDLRRWRNGDHRRERAPHPGTPGVGVDEPSRATKRGSQLFTLEDADDDELANATLVEQFQEADAA
jgi:hypothetical protein